MPDLVPENPINFNENPEVFRLKPVPVDYTRILGEARILFIGEDHHNFSIPDHVEEHAPDFKKAGITHFAIEADTNEVNDDALEKLNRGEKLDRLPFGLEAGTLGPYIYRDQILAVARQGIQIVAVDRLQYDDPEAREAFMTDNLSKILQDPNARVAFRVGLNHANRRRDIEAGVPSVANRLSREGFPISVVDFIGGEIVDTDDEPRLEALGERIRRAGLAEEEFMFESDPSLNDSGADFYIHLPEY